MADSIQGRFKVRRISGLLPPIGLSKSFDGKVGVTRILSVPLMPFRVIGRKLQYFGLPIEDRLTPRGDGGFVGEGYIFGKRFCRFGLDPA